MSDASETQDPRGPAPAAGPPAAASKTEAQRPATVGNYLLQKKLGEGAAGEVWLAKDRVLGRDVALKFVRADAARGDSDVREFLKEARAAAKLNHPNIVTVYQVGRDSGRVYIAMEFVPGGSLADELRDKGALPWREATQAIRDAAAGLAEAHSAGLIHRDIKPSNLMRSARGLVKVVDFGLARTESYDAGMTRTQPGMLLGSPAYMSPEQCLGTRADARSDLYSLICAYYQLLTRQFPFEGAGMAAVLYQHCHQPFPDASKKVMNLPGEVLAILSRGSQKKPEDRYQTAAALLADLDALLAIPEMSLARERSSPPKKSDAAKRSAGEILLPILKGQGIMGKLTWAATLLIVGVLSAVSLHRALAAGRQDSTKPLAGKQPVPNVRDQFKAEQTIKGLFKTEYADHTFDAKIALANKLLTQGQATADNIPARYVCYREARDLAASAADLETADAAIDAMDKEFVIDALDQRATAFATAVPLKSADDSPAAIDAGWPLLDQLVAAENFTAAGKILGALEAAATKSKQLPLVTKVQARRTEVFELQRDANRVRNAREALKRDANDPAANLTLGKYLATQKGDWDAALPLLARGADDPLKVLAAKELGKPADAKAQLLLADGFWDLGDKQTESAKARLQQHAAIWYEKAAPSLAGLDKAKAESRISEDARSRIQQLATATPKPIAPAVQTPVADAPSHVDAQGHRVVNLMPLIDPARDGIGGTWKRDKKGLVVSPTDDDSAARMMVMLPYEPPAEYDFRIEFTRTDGESDIQQMLSHDGTRFSYGMDTFVEKHVAGFQQLKDTGHDAITPALVQRSAAIENNRLHISIVSIRKGSISATLDGQSVVNYPTDYKDIEPRAAWDLGMPVLGLGAWKNSVVFHLIEVTEIAGKGKILAWPPRGLDAPVRTVSRRDREVRQVSFFNDNQNLLVYYAAQDVAAYTNVDLRSGDLKFLSGCRVWVTQRPANRRISWGDGIELRDLDGNKITPALAGMNSEFVGVAAFSADGRTVAVGRGDVNTRVTVWSSVDGSRIAEVPADSVVESAALSPDGAQLAFATSHGSIVGWVVGAKQKLWSIGSDHPALSYSADGKVILAGPLHNSVESFTGHCKVIDAKTGRVIATLPNEANDAAISPDGHLVVTGDATPDIGLQLWDVATGKDLHRFHDTTGPVQSVLISPDGKRVLAGCADGNVRLLDIGTGKQLADFGWHIGPVLCLAFSSDGRLAASGGMDRRAAVWRLPDPGSEAPPAAPTQPGTSPANRGDLKFADGQWTRRWTEKGADLDGSLRIQTYNVFSNGTRVKAFSWDLPFVHEADGSLSIEGSRFFQTFSRNGDAVRVCEWKTRADYLAKKPPIYIGVFEPKGSAAPPPLIPELPSHVDAQGHRVVDLMPLIDLQRDGWPYPLHRGTEAADAAAIVSPWDIVQIRYQTPEEYDFEVEFVTDKDVVDVRLGFSQNGRTCWWNINPTHSGFDRIAGKAFDDPKNPTQMPGSDLIAPGVRHVATVRVRRDGITGVLDGKVRAQCKTDGSDLDGSWSYFKNGSLALYSERGNAVYHRIEVVEIKGSGRAALSTPDAKLIRADRPKINGIDRLQFAKEGKLLVVGSGQEGGGAAVIEADSGRQLFSPPNHFNLDDFTPDGRLLLGRENSHELRLFDLANGSSKSSKFGESENNSFSPDHQLIAQSDPAWYKIGRFTLWNTSTLTKVWEATPAEGYDRIAFSPDGSKFAGAHGHTVFIWDTKTFKPLGSFKESSDWGIDSVRFFPDNQRVLITFWVMAKVWDPRDGAEHAVLKDWGGAHLMTRMSPDGQTIVGFEWWGNHNQINLWSADTGEILHKFKDIPGVSSAEFSPDGTRILLGAADGFAYLIDAKTFAEVARFGGHDGPITAVAFHPTGATIATGCTDGVIRYFQVPNGGK